MCGRYALCAPPELLATLLRLARAMPFAPRYNIAPTQSAPVVIEGAHGREMTEMRWGLIPFWAKDPSIGSRLINARSESAPDKPAFRDAYRKRRCLVPATGFFEWRKLAGTKTKQPYFIRRADGDPMVFAGLWEEWRSPNDGSVRTFTILTTDANDQLRPLHDRMPVLLSAGESDGWLGPRDETSGRYPFVPTPDDLLALYPVSTRVNSPRFDEPSLITPVEARDAESSKGNGMGLFS